MSEKPLYVRKSTEILDHSPGFSKSVSARLDSEAGVVARPVGSKGSAGRKVRVALCEEQGWLCYWCDKPMVDGGREPPRLPDHATFDHIIPRSEGGSAAKSNGVASCLACNRRRGNLAFDLFAEIIDAEA